LRKLKITRKDIKKISIISTAAAITFFIISFVIFLTSPTLDYMVVIALTIAVAPPSVASILHNTWKNKIEKMTPEFMRDLATASKTGMPLQTALEHASKRQYGPLTAELKILVSQMSWGMNFNQAMMEFSNRIDLPVIRKATVLILEAGRHGGNLHDIFESTAKYVENVNSWSARRRMQTMPYVAIFYFSLFIYLFIIIIISNMMFTPLSQMETSGVPFLQSVLAPSQARRVFLHTALMESLFGGLIAGKINENTFSAGLKHATVLALSSGLAFYFFFI
jgi:archaeal flagellar protein FlaJ